MCSHHALQPSPAGKLSPNLNTLPLNLHTCISGGPGMGVDGMALVHPCPHPLEQHFSPSLQSSSAEHNSTQFPMASGGRGGQMRDGGRQAISVHTTLFGAMQVLHREERNKNSTRYQLKIIRE